MQTNFLLSSALLHPSPTVHRIVLVCVVEWERDLYFIQSTYVLKTFFVRDFSLVTKLKRKKKRKYDSNTHSPDFEIAPNRYIFQQVEKNRIKKTKMTLHVVWYEIYMRIWCWINSKELSFLSDVSVDNDNNFWWSYLVFRTWN